VEIVAPLGLTSRLIAMAAVCAAVLKTDATHIVGSNVGFTRSLLGRKVVLALLPARDGPMVPYAEGTIRSLLSLVVLKGRCGVREVTNIAAPNDLDTSKVGRGVGDHACMASHGLGKAVNS
jgi:hypothetical protein